MASKQTTAAMFERMFHEANCPEARKQVAGMARVAAVKVTNAKGEPVEHTEMDYEYGNRFYFNDGSAITLGMVD